MVLSKRKGGISVESSAKSSRVLELYKKFLQGKVVSKEKAAEYYGVNMKSIQRDIDTIRDFLADQASERGVLQSIEYDSQEKGYRLVTQEIDRLTEGEMLAICKILIESRAFSKAEISSLLERLLNLCVSQKDRDQIQWYIANEIFNYADPAHASPNTDFLWSIARAIKEQRILNISYSRLKGKEVVQRRVMPVGILFSEFYFYLMGVISSPDMRKGFEHENDPFPTIYRVDRLHALEVTEENFSVDYKERFQEGAYKNRNQFMFGGETQNIEFIYSGPSVEAVLDKLPMSQVNKNTDGTYTIHAETFGKGILMWLLSQGNKVEVLAPESLRKEWIGEARSILAHATQDDIS
jgi:predicted DNA-binding transcriptional regulator YafY